MYHDDWSGAAGAVLSDHKGEVIGASCCPLTNVLDTTTAGSSQGMEFLEQIGCSHMTIESDSLELIQSCNGSVEVLSPYSAILAEYFVKASQMSEVSFQHYPREANQVAHELAQFDFKSQEFRF
jgi:ribonuclease HI